MSNLSTTAAKPAPKILLVKLSSLGDVLHNLPIIWDLRRHLPDAQIDWVVEESYVHLLKPLLTRESFKGIDHIIPFSLRRWKKHLGTFATWREFFVFKKELQKTKYDIVIETQGLLKSALVCALAHTNSQAVVAGLANATEFSGYEPVARLFYNRSIPVPVQSHAVDRSRQVASTALDLPLFERAQTPQFYPASFVASILPHAIAGIQTPYILFFHSTARQAKRWPDASWIALGQALSKQGYQIVLPWGSPAEKIVSQRLAKQVPESFVPPAFSIEAAFAVIAGAALTIGVDTGLTHLAAVLDKPTVEIYCDSPKWKTEGYWSKQICNVGDMQEPPNVDTVLLAGLSLLTTPL
jgi:heptosyltransferase-1